MTDAAELQPKSRGYKKINPEAGKPYQFKKGQSGNPKGQPKGSKHINTWVQELIEDEEFTATIREGLQIKEWKGAPIKAIIKAQITKAMGGDTLAYKALVDSGWTKRSEVEQSGEITHKFEEMDDEQLEAAIKARENRISRTA